MGISSPGIGSGIDVSSIVTKLMDAESAPLNSLKAKESSYNAKISAYGALKNALSNFQSSLKGLSSDRLNLQTATSSNTEILSVNANSDAKPGNYAIQVTQLALAHSMASKVTNGQLSTTTPLASGKMDIMIGGSSTPAISIAPAVYTLQGISDAINTANAGVKATIVNNGTTNLLVISANDTGTANTIKIAAAGGLAIFDSANMDQSQPPQDAEIKINGVTVKKSSNTITDAISGLTLQLGKADAASTVNVKVTTDKAAVKATVSGFITAYNALSTTIKNMTAYDAATKKSGSLNGDQGATSVLNALRAELGKAVTGSGLTTLHDIGMTFQRDGTLAVDDAKLQKALDTKFDDVAKLFSSADGYATRLTKLTDDMLGTKGLIAGRTEGLQGTIKNIVKSQDALQIRLEATEKRLRAQFTALDSMLSNMQSTSSYLTQQLSALAANNGN